MNNILDFAAKIHKQFFIGGLVVFVILVILMSLNIDINGRVKLEVRHKPPN
uniref:hypothetical protein n=1 Tax=Acinetobacter nosocomialis TaxID=106654 RepID=UPI001EFF3307|nr:hypothetical protein [Acinetobacter nosocomialis]UKC63480.1 hypothetical protein FA267_2_00006 [Acinetobacter nosocomialis]UKC63661.1 hypothetical protein FA648_2_00052 [Acinetobacter nosocomialis]